MGNLACNTSYMTYLYTGRILHMPKRREIYRLFKPRFDWRMIRDQVGDSAFGNGYLEIEVKNPRTHIQNEKALYTDYEIEVKTNHPAFPLFHSQVRRRYSEFVWLRNNLGLDDVLMQHVPQLPRKRLIGRFKDTFLWQRQKGLEEFLNRLANITAFANNPAFLLFLQTSLTNKEMDYYLKTRTPGGIRSLTLRLHDKKLRADEKKRRPRTKTFSAEYPATEKSQSLKSKSYGKSWSSIGGESIFDEPAVDIPEPKHMKTMRSISCIACPSGMLTLPTIPGSSEDGLDSMRSESLTDPESHSEEHPLSRSWHGTPRDEIDLVLEDYEIIPLDSITRVQVPSVVDDEVEELFGMDLDYVEVNPEWGFTHDHRFDY
ncbi:sorting nexin-10-like isoform X2 [Montipora foliosa]|uniref:sorting nexin-10-like isoform X2 n=1 Tax=Montipora foliosa TaxID=591990 RepID=UPI0035F1FB95